MREAFFSALKAQARANPKIVLIVGDLGFSVIEPFAREFPDRLINAGVAEQNMMGVAAGLASEGFYPFVYSIANFPTFRCLEQIRNDICYHRYPVVIAAVGGGLAYGNLGYSHHAVQDYAVMRCLHPITIAAPGDPLETRGAVNWLADHPRPAYLRLGKNEEIVTDAKARVFADGKVIRVKKSLKRTAYAFVTTGATLCYALRAASKSVLAGAWDVLSIPIWSEAAKLKIGARLKKYKKIVTVEDHLSAGGFGSYIQESLSTITNSQLIHSIYLKNKVCDMVGDQNFLNSAGGISEEALIKRALAVMKEN